MGLIVGRVKTGISSSVRLNFRTLCVRRYKRVWVLNQVFGSV